MPIDPTRLSPKFAPVILAGGSGTRFWPRSRRARPKQVLALDGERTMLQQTAERLLALAPWSDLWVIANDLLNANIRAQLPEVSPSCILSEPAARNTAPAAGLAAFLLEPVSPDTVIGIFPADHAVEDPAEFLRVVRDGIRVAGAGENIVVLGVPAAYAATGYGYIEGGSDAHVGGVQAGRVRRFTEKPARQQAQAFVDAGNYTWNSGIFLVTARTLANAIREHCPDMAPLLQRIAAAYGTAEFERVFAEAYPMCENISIDYAVMEPRSAKGEDASGIYFLKANFGWNDIGSWAALREHKQKQAAASREHGNVVEAEDVVVIEAQGNYVFALGKTVALLGVDGLVVVETEDAILVTTLDRSQDVGKIVAELKQRGRMDLT